MVFEYNEVWLLDDNGYWIGFHKWGPFIDLGLGRGTIRPYDGKWRPYPPYRPEVRYDTCEKLKEKYGM